MYFYEDEKTFDLHEIQIIKLNITCILLLYIQRLRKIRIARLFFNRQVIFSLVNLEFENIEEIHCFLHFSDFAYFYDQFK